MRRISVIFIMFLGLAVAGMTGSTGSGEERVVKHLRYPDYNEQGKLNFELIGDEAKIRPDGLIQVENLVLTFYEEGEVMMRVTSPSCLFDRVNQTAVSTSSVCVTRSEIVLTGQGFEWSAKEGGFKIRDQAKVVLRYGKREPGGEKTQ